MLRVLSLESITSQFVFISNIIPRNIIYTFSIIAFEQGKQLQWRHEDKNRYVRLLKRKIMMTKDILRFHLFMGKYDTMMMVTPLIVTLHKSTKKLCQSPSSIIYNRNTIFLLPPPPSLWTKKWSSELQGSSLLNYLNIGLHHNLLFCLFIEQLLIFLQP